MRHAPYPLTLRQLQYAAAIAETGSFRKAAEACRVAQPSLSAQVAELERGLGVALFERDRRRVLVTPAGAALLERARRMLIEADDLVEAARRMSDPRVGTLRIGVLPTISPYLLPEVLPALRAAYPRLTVLWAEDRTAALVEQVQRGALDAALLALEAELGDLEHATLGRDPFVVAAPRGHRLAQGTGPIDPSALADERVLLLEDGHCLRDQVLSFCARVQAEEQSFRATSLTTLVQMVLGGAGVTLLPKLALATENRRGELVVRTLTPPVPQRTLALAWRPTSPRAELLRELARTLRSAALDPELGGRGRKSAAA